MTIVANILPDHHIEVMLFLRRTMNSPTIGEWSDQEYDVIDGVALVGRILRSQFAPSDRPWLWVITGRPSGDGDNRGYATSLATAMSELTSQWETVGPAGA